MLKFLSDPRSYQVHSGGGQIGVIVWDQMWNRCSGNG